MTSELAQRGHIVKQATPSRPTGGYPADTCLRELAAGHPMQVVLRRHGYDPVSRRHPANRR
jgi:hypothetical protein